MSQKFNTIYNSELKTQKFRVVNIWGGVMSRSKYKKFIEVKKDAPIYAKRIAIIMNKKGWSQKDLSERCKGEISVSEGTITGWLQGVDGKYTEPRIKAFNEVARVLGVSVDYLMGNTNVASTNAATQAVANYTGLSEQATKKLHEYSRENRKTAYCDVMSTLIENGNCEYFLAMIGKRISYSHEKKGLQGNALVKNMIERTMHLDIDGISASVYKDSLIDSILQTEFVKLLNVVSDEYFENYSITPSERQREWRCFSREYSEKVENGEITIEQYNEIIDKWLSKKDGEQ